MRQTKIIATVGPASDTDAVLDALIAAGVDIVRLNFSHGTHETHAATYARVREAAKRAKREVAILQDLGGPKIRTGPVEGGRPIHLEAGPHASNFDGRISRNSRAHLDDLRRPRAGRASRRSPAAVGWDDRVARRLN